MAISSRLAHRENIRKTDDQRSNKTRRRRPSHPSPHSHASSAMVDAVTNPDSEYNELARYLLLPSRRTNDGNNDDASSSTAKTAIFGDNHDKQDSMRRYSSDAYALAVEPVEIRSERVIMLAEAYAMWVTNYSIQR
eukprot:scaffold161377_cov89-Cyclotella_meneghiniana.AAC.1